MGRMFFQQQGFITSSRLWTESLFRERGVRPILGAHVQRVEPNRIHYETLDGTEAVQPFDFAMLLPPSAGRSCRPSTGQARTSPPPSSRRAAS
ncbi:MAG: hypothetical protein IPG75_22540 [Gemmatimonadetes bacterium]|nr:hypothetical protein [Gemmatimonadota bacterium]